MPAERLGKDVRCLSRTLSASSVEVILHLGTEARVYAIVDDELCSLLRSLTAKVSVTMLCNQNHYVMLCVVNVRAHGNDGRDLSAFSCGRRYEEGDRSVKSPEPPIPFIILVPVVCVEFTLP